jgi:hypothetical protein
MRETQTRHRGAARLILLAALSAVTLLGQGDRGVITGTVTDATGATIPGAVITVVQKGTNTSFKTTTSTSGDFTVPSLPVGSYQVRTERPSFKTNITDSVVVVAGGSVRMDVTLEVGQTQQSVEVTATAQLVQSENARISTSVSSVLVDSLPVQVNGASRSPFDLASTTAEVNSAGTFRIGGGNNTVGISLDGASLAGDKIGSDAGNGGAAAMNSPSVEALTEFNVEAGGFKAETGHVSGGNLSFVSKSGTNQFHGSAFEFLRNQDLDARGFFNTQKSVYKQNDFGVTAGGPLYLPKVYNGKNKTFFFASYEGFRNRVGAGNGSLSSVAPPEFYTGDLHNWVDGNGKMYQIYDPGSQQLVNGAYVRAPFAGNLIPQNRIDPVAKSIANFVGGILKPNVANLVPGTSGYVRQNFFSTGTSSSPSNRWSAKVDQNLGTKHHISYLMNRYRDDALPGANGAPGLPYPIGGYNFGFNTTQVYRGTWDYTVTPTLMNHFNGGFNYFREDHGSMAISEDSPQSEGFTGLLPAGYWKTKGICIPNYPQCANFPIISTGDFAGWGTNGPNGSDRLVFELHDDMTKVKGPHTLKWGYFYGNSHYDGFGLQNGSGSMGFSFTGTSTPLATSQANGGGSGFASFLLGAVNNYALDTPRYLTALYRTHQVYFQDDWRVSRKLTFNLGFRYDMNVAPMSVDDKISDFSPTTPNPGAGGRLGATIFVGSGEGRIGRRNIIDNWYGGYEPRFGFAYAVNDKTTIRGAATRSFGPVAGIGQSSHNLGFAVRLTVSTNPSGGLTPMWNLKDGAPAWPPPPTLDPAVGIGTNPPYYGGNQANRPDSELNYSFNIQRQLTGSSVLEIDYLATLASDITSNFLAVNQVPYRSLPASLSPFTAAGRTALGSQVGSAAATAAGVTAPPWTCGAGSSPSCVSFAGLYGGSATVTQAMRPYPQYTTINTLDGGGDRIGHSTYHSVMFKYNKRMASGLTVQASYKISKLLTDTDSTGSAAGDMYNLKLLKSIAAFDQTHQVKLSWVYELPFGKGKHFLSGGGVAARIVGGWRVSAIQTYASGLPSNLASTVSFPIGDFSNRPTISTYDGWRGPVSGEKFDPFKDSWLQPQSFFPTQPITAFGNSTRFNPKFRGSPSMSENPSVARIFSIRERLRFEFRAEAFNVLNRVFFAPLGGATTLGNANWGLWRNQANGPRTMQLVGKITW